MPSSRAPRPTPSKVSAIEGLKLLAEAREETGLPVVSEITDPGDVEVFERYVDMLQVGARNMANFVLLKAVGQSRKPVLLKRGLSATIEEWLMAAEYILSSGNPNVVLCERGIRTFETATRNTLDLSAVPVIRERTHLPVMVDPSHGTGHRPLVRPLAVAGAAVGADGIIIEVHPDPPMARSDSEQSLSFPEFGDLMDDLRRQEYLRNPTARSTYVPAEPPAERRRLRARIEDVDARIAALLEERAELSVAVQQTRAADDHGHDVGRERELIERAAHLEGGVLTAEEREMVFGTILRVSRSAQRRSAADREAAAAAARDERCPRHGHPNATLTMDGPSPRQREPSGVVSLAGRLAGRLRLPADKSVAHRALLLNAMGAGGATVRLDRPGGDVLSMAGALRSLGAITDLVTDGAGVTVVATGAEALTRRRACRVRAGRRSTAATLGPRCGCWPGRWPADRARRR